MNNFSLTKTLALLGFLQLLAPSLANDDCIPPPKRLVDGVLECANGNIEEAESLMKDIEAIDYALCFYRRIGYYHDGAFDLEYVKKFLEASHPDKEIMHRIYEWNAIRMEEANEVQGDDRDRTYSFWLSTYDDEEVQELTENLWC